MSLTHEEESKRLQALNQRFGFLMNGLMFVKTRQAGGDKDTGLEILGKRAEKECEEMIRRELEGPEKASTPLKVL